MVPDFRGAGCGPISKGELIQFHEGIRCGGALCFVIFACYRLFRAGRAVSEVFPQQRVVVSPSSFCGRKESVHAS